MEGLGTGKNQNLRIMQWNCRSINTTISYLKDFLYNESCDILALQSTNVHYSKLPKLDGFYYPPVIDIKNKGKLIKVATYIRCGLSYDVETSPVSSEENVWSCLVQVHMKGSKNLNVLNIYYPTGCAKSGRTAWISNISHKNKNWLIAGDFNDRHVMWERDYPPGKKSYLADCIMDSGFQLLNDGEITRIPDSHVCKASAIDLTLISNSLFLQTDWHAFPDTLHSDHIVILTSIHSSEPDKINTLPQQPYSYNKADWQHFQQVLSETKLEDVKNEDINIFYENIRTKVLTAVDLCIPKKVNKVFNEAKVSSWWNEECSKVVEAKRARIKAFSRNQNSINYNLMKEAESTCALTIAKAKLSHWEEFVDSSVKDYKDSGKVWKKLKRHKRRTRLPEKPLTVNGTKTATDLDKEMC